MATTANFNVLNVYTWRSFDVISAYTCVRIGIKMFVVRSHSQTVAKSGVWRCLFRSTHATLSCRCDSCVCVRLCECDETPTQALLQWNKQLQTWKKMHTKYDSLALCALHPALDVFVWLCREIFLSKKQRVYVFSSKACAVQRRHHVFAPFSSHWNWRKIVSANEMIAFTYLLVLSPSLSSSRSCAKIGF